MTKSTRVLNALALCSLIGACGGEDADAGPVAPAAVPATPVGTPGTSAVATPGATPGMTTTPGATVPGPAMTPTAGTAGDTPAIVPSAGAAPVAQTPTFPDLRGACNLNSGYPGDDACMLPPDPSEGFQIHVGPDDYSAAAVRPFLMQAGGESSECWDFITPNTEAVNYQTFVLSGRDGTHHIINSMYNTGGPLRGAFGVCRDPGTGTNADLIDNLPGASKPYMPRTPVAPENAKIGRIIPPQTFSQADMHYFNFTDGPVLREFWLNIYYAPEGATERADQIRGMGGLSWSALPIAPGTNNVYRYECPLVGSGRILGLLGHYHAHGVRFSASVRRTTGAVEKVFEMYDYLDPAQFAYDTVSQNPAFSATQAGAVSGPLEVNTGDVLMWECHIINDSAVGLTYSNFVETGEMCNLWGSSIGISPVNCVLP